MKTPANWLRRGWKFFSSSIRNRIIIPYALLTLVLATFGAFVVTQLVAGSFEERLNNQLIDAGRVVSEEVVNREEKRLEVERTIANTLGMPEAVINRNAQELERLIAPIIANSQNTDAIIVVDTQGKEIIRFQRDLSAATTPPALIYTDTGINLFSWQAVAGVLSDPLGTTKDVQLAQAHKSNELMVYTVGPIRTDSGTVGAVLVGTYLQNEVNDFRSVALAHVTLFNERAEVIISTLMPDKAEANKVFQVFTPQRFQEVVKQKESVTFLSQVEGVADPNNIEAGDQTYRLAFAPFILRDHLYGVYAVALPTNFITEINDENRIWLSLIFSGGVVAVLVIGYVVSQRIIRPVIRLVQISHEIASGNLDQRTGLKSDDEIGILASTFDNMTAELQKKTIALREEASKLNAILNSIADGVIVLDLEGNIITTNPAAEKIVSVIGPDLGMVQLHQEKGEKHQPPSNQQVQSLLEQLTGLEFHETRRFEMGRQTLSALSAPVVTLDGALIGSVVVLRDITREVEAERLKDDFITSMSHELRTPPTAIKGYNDLLKMMASNKLSQRELSYIDAIEQNVTDLLKIIQQMLDLSQIDAGTLGIDQEEQNLVEIIETEAEQWFELMAEKELSFSVQVSDEPLWVVGDWSRLSQVIHNLLSNACNYTLPGGKVEITVTQVDNEAQIDIKDTGVGISKENQRFLFTRFFRAIHQEDTFEVSGAGLGLYMSKAIIEAHRGRIWMESELNQGSTFSFALPLINPAMMNAAQTIEYAQT